MSAVEYAKNVRRLSFDGDDEECNSPTKKREPTKKCQTISEILKPKFMATSKRILAFAEPRSIAKDGAKIVYIDGSFDTFHLRHVEMLKKAKKLGDYVFVGVHDDQVSLEFLI